VNEVAELRAYGLRGRIEGRLDDQGVACDGALNRKGAIRNEILYLAL
jgi:hypothetical protein